MTSDCIVRVQVQNVYIILPALLFHSMRHAHVVSSSESRRQISFGSFGSLQESANHLLYSKENYVMLARRNKQDLSSWSIEEILTHSEIDKLWGKVHLYGALECPVQRKQLFVLPHKCIQQKVAHH